MTQYIYMNHRIKQKRPRKPVIVCQRTDPAQTIESNCLVLMVGGRAIGKVVFDRSGLDACKTHDVKAWVELSDQVTVVADTAVVTEHWHVDVGTHSKLLRAAPASEKKPNTVVNIVELTPPQ